MSDPVVVDIFVEDRAHEALLVPLVRRVAREQGVSVEPRVRSARGGPGRAVEELKLYQRLVIEGAAGATTPAVLVVGIDGNCSSLAKKRREIESATVDRLTNSLVVACPDPHVERWYVADPDSFETVVGHRPSIGRKKCVRDYYKEVLATAVQQAGHPPTLGGIEFASELVAAMDLYRAGKNDHSLRSFVDGLRAKLRQEVTE